jgi:hypothetical protein
VETHRLARVRAPVRGVELQQRLAGEVGDDGNARRLEGMRRGGAFQGRQHRIEQRRMERVRHRQLGAAQSLRAQRGGEALERRELARPRRVRGPVDGGDRQVAAGAGKEWLETRGRGGDDQHAAARGQRLHEARALRDELEHRLLLDRAGDRGGRVLADAVSHDGDGLDAPRAPLRRERQLERDHERLRVAGVVDRRLAESELERRPAEQPVEALRVTVEGPRGTRVASRRRGRPCRRTARPGR